VLDRVLALAEQKLRSNQIDAIVRCPTEPLLVQAPPDQLGQVFLNLIMNAAEAMDQVVHFGLTSRRSIK
jgi:signal transduction histidine kinase